jgi:formylglycine-generating enzyme required for sulfatase activity/proteasome lid subunit RPN8/RPN11
MIADNIVDRGNRCPPQDHPIVLPGPLQERLLTEIRRRLPIKSFGYLISEGDPRKPADFLIFESNIRNSAEWKPTFESYGQYFLEHEDAGFVATPEESWQMQKRMWARGMVAIGVFHSHLRHPANFSSIDYEMHMQGLDDLWHMIVSVRNEQSVQIRAFSTGRTGVRELPVVIAPADHSVTSGRNSEGPRKGRDQAICQARRILSLGHDGRPTHKDSKAIFDTVTDLLRTGDSEAIDQLLAKGFLAGSAERFEQYLSTTMRELEGGQFEMGTCDSECAYFVGESPRHTVALSPFKIAAVPVTNELLGIFDERWLTVPAADREKPAVDVTWYEAVVFAMWMGCRLPTEAEWEFACGGGVEGEWSCVDEDLLHRCAWYSMNSKGQAHVVGSLEPNKFGLFDLHGNVWEWCNDGYDQDYYGRCRTVNPPGSELADSNKVCRGGSFHALSEMCRTRYRFHDPPGFSAWDLGFRLAKNTEPQATEVKL